MVAARPGGTFGRACCFMGPRFRVDPRTVSESRGYRLLGVGVVPQRASIYRASGQVACAAPVMAPSHPTRPCCSVGSTPRAHESSHQTRGASCRLTRSPVSVINCGCVSSDRPKMCQAFRIHVRPQWEACPGSHAGFRTSRNAAIATTGSGHSARWPRATASNAACLRCCNVRT